MEALKITKKIIPENAFEHKKKKPGLKFNPGLRANRPSNKWALIFRRSDPSEVAGRELKNDSFLTSADFSVQKQSILL